MYDVIVVGAGPGGTITAKRCAEHGLKALILEKHQLPRHKICGGMVMGPIARAIIKQEYGDIPETVLSNPPYLSGYIVHVPGIGDKKLNNITPISWRKNLDYWMNQKAEAKGVEIWPSARVAGLRQKGQSFSVEIEKDGVKQAVEAKFVVGADGAKSLIRGILFPELKPDYRQTYQEGFPGELDLDKTSYHWFFAVDRNPPFFSIHQKDNAIVINVSGEPGQAKKSISRAKAFLAKNYGFDNSQKPAWRDGCLELRLHEELFSRTFLPAKGNVLLVGDAAGIIMPVSGEGIGTAFQSGLMAADAISKAIDSGGQAENTYLTEFESIISVIKELSPLPVKVNKEIEAGGRSLHEVFIDAYSRKLKVF